jgi:hypothetical protein
MPRYVCAGGCGKPPRYHVTVKDLQIATVNSAAYCPDCWHILTRFECEHCLLRVVLKAQRHKPVPPQRPDSAPNTPDRP